MSQENVEVVRPLGRGVGAKLPRMAGLWLARAISRTLYTYADQM